MSARRELLRRVRAALGRPGEVGEAVPAPEPDEAIVRRCGPGEDLAAHFERAATGSGMEVRCVTESRLEAALGELLAELGARRIGVCAGRDELAQRVRDVVGRGGGEPIDAVIETLFDADVVVSDVAGAIAETGTLVIRSGPPHSRGLHAVPPVHVAIVQAGQIVADLVDWARGEAGSCAGSSATVLVTGPSKTADIEGTLVTGVHGPERVVILLVES